ncbi:MAG: hypothetical protein K6C36_05530 [Clostridia bacterium]|nr:hypothetical protein [Clostridia bacterium]
MKKTLAVLLSILMLIGCAPIVFATDYNRTTDFTSNFTLQEGSSLTIPSGAMVHIASGVTVTINSGSGMIVSGTLIVNAGGKLVVKGNATVSGTLQNNGTVTGTANINTVNNGTFLHRVDLSAYSDTNEFGEGLLAVSYDVCEDLDPESFQFTSVSSVGGYVNVPHGQYIVVKAHLNDSYLYSFNAKYGANGFDDAREAVYFNGAEMQYTGTSHNVDGYTDTSFEDYHGHYIKVGASGTVSYQPISMDSAYKNAPAKYFTSRLTRYTVLLPSKDEAYTVQATNGATGAVEVKAGDSISFMVKVGADYSQSDFRVYAYDSLKWVDATTDEIIATASGDGSTGVVQFENGNDSFGYNEKTGMYTIKNVQSNYKVIVVGVIANKYVDIFQSVIDLIQRLFNTFKDVFEQFANALSSLGISFGGNTEPAEDTGAEG